MSFRNVCSFMCKSLVPTCKNIPKGVTLKHAKVHRLELKESRCVVGWLAGWILPRHLSFGFRTHHCFLSFEVEIYGVECL